MAERIRECYLDGILFDIVECDDHRWEEFLVGLEAWRHEFNALLDRGISREAANDALIDRIKAGDQPPRCANAT